MMDVWCLMFDLSLLMCWQMCVYIYIHIVYGWSRQWQFLQGFDHGACLGANLQQRNGSGFLERLLQQVDRLKLLHLPWIAHAACTQGNHRWRHATSEHRYGMMIWVHKGPIYIYIYYIYVYYIYIQYTSIIPSPRTSVTASWAACDSAMVLLFLAFSSPRNLVASDKALPRRAMASERGQGPQERGCHLGRCHITQNSMQCQCRHCSMIEIHLILAGQNLNLISVSELQSLWQRHQEISLSPSAAWAK